MSSHRFPLSNCSLSVVAAGRAFFPRIVIATVNATITHIFSKAQRMWDEFPVGKKKRRSLSPHHDNPSIVSGSSHDDLGRYMTIDMLPDDILLEIFDHHRLAAMEYSLLGPWEWHRLAHVCQRWRSVIFTSPRRLNLRLVYTYRKPVRKTLDCWPALPISIWYPRLVLNHPLYPADEVNVISALEHSDRICDINLTLTRPLLDKLTPLMQDPFPALEYLQLGFRDMMGSLVLPSGFLGGSTPQLRHIDLDGTPFPTLPRLLLSAANLTYLRLYEIPSTGYFSPDALVAGLDAKSKLEFLEIHFLHPTSPLGQESPRASPHPPTRAVLPALTEFQFRGDNAYLEDLISRINAPNLEQFGIALFNQPTFELLRLAEFIGRTEKLKTPPFRTSVWFWERGFSITHYFGHPPSGDSFRLEISCHGLARQVTLLGGICRQLSLLVNGVERLDIEADRALTDAGADSDLDPDEVAEQWLDLFAPFSSVRRLELIGTPVPSMASALERSAAGEGGPEVLPSMESLHLRGPVMSSPIESFVAARQVVSVHFTSESPIEDDRSADADHLPDHSA